MAKKNDKPQNKTKQEIELESGLQAGQEIKNEVLTTMDSAGLTLDFGLDKLKELLNAQKPISCIKGKEADGGTVDFVDVPDNQAQIKALDMLFSLRGAYAEKKVKADVNTTGTINIAVIDKFGK